MSGSREIATSLASSLAACAGSYLTLEGGGAPRGCGASFTALPCTLRQSFPLTGAGADLAAIGDCAAVDDVGRSSIDVEVDSTVDHPRRAHSGEHRACAGRGTRDRRDHAWHTRAWRHSRRHGRRPARMRPAVQCRADLSLRLPGDDVRDGGESSVEMQPLRLALRRVEGRSPYDLPALAVRLASTASRRFAGANPMRALPCHLRSSSNR